ncbi:MAG: thermonuclease family protein, partial [Chloroflexi bacterium]|nr:thermonuclease family protein [Chloroflexota bacterium]
IGLVEGPDLLRSEDELEDNPEGPSLRDRELSERPQSGKPGKWLARAGFAFLALAVLSMVIPAILVFLPARGQDPADTRSRIKAEVIDIIDGATIQVKIDGKPYAVRYLGVELAPPGDLWRTYAGAANREWVEGQTVFLERDITDADAEGRLLRYVWVGDDLMVNAALIAVGLARYSEEPPDVRYSAVLKQFESNARAEKTGIWRTRGA